MTRFLSASLQAKEPQFGLGLRKLEMANGQPAADIRLSSEIIQALPAKLQQLALDPRNTTPQELYRALQEKVRVDDARLTKYLRTQAAHHVSAEADVVAGMVHAIKRLPDTRECFALKTSVLKSVLKTTPPRRAIKQLGYRSVDSCLKHEAPLLILASGWLIEGPAWQKRLLDQYKKLQPRDFENRQLIVLQPTSERWTKLAQGIVEQRRHNLVGFREMGALLFLPLPKNVEPGVVTASLSLALHEVNEISAASTFLKLSQVRTEFSQCVCTVASGEAHLGSQLLDQPVPWHLIQRYYARLGHHFRAEVFEPYLQLEDMVWQPIEETLAKLDAGFSFWQNTAHLGKLDGHRPVSLNLLDVALNLCNRLPYEQRLAHYFQRSLWHELLLRYLHRHPVEQSVLAEVQPQLAPETVSV